MTRDDPAAFAPPPAFGPFRVLHQIGIGALGPVFRTYEPTRDRLVAVKVFRLDVTPEHAQSLADELARAADAALFHPSIVEPIAAGVEGTVAYRAEEYVAAESLDVAVRHYAPASAEKALPFLTQLAGAIDFARTAGVGHGALHLRDIFVTPDEARASGFGVVEALERVGLRAPVRRPYSAPERIAGEAWSTPADVFSLGAIAYELLTGRRPSGTGDQIGAVTMESGEHAAIRAVLARAMADDPARRYPTALAFVSALEAAAREGAAVSSAAGSPNLRAAVAAPLATAASEARPEPSVEREDHAASEHEQDAAATQEQEGEPEEAHDIVAERDDDAAHHALLRDEPDEAVDEPASALFDEEAAADLAEASRDYSISGAYIADEAARDARHNRIRPAADDYAGEEEARDGDELPAFREVQAIDASAAPEEEVRSVTTVERSRPAMLPLAVTLILGLLIGFAAGYAVRSRENAAPQTAAAPAPAAPVAAPVQAPQGRPQEPGRAWSEQAVAPVAPPPVPGDAPPASSGAGRAGPAPRAAAGRITVSSTPSGAGVSVNGRWRGRTPLTLDALRFGPYTVRIVQPGFTVARQEVDLSAAQPSRSLSFRLQRGGTPSAQSGTGGVPAPGAELSRLVGAIYVDSRPRGARVLIDGRPSGTTPALVPAVAVGSHVVRLELPDHKTWTASTRVAAGKQTPVTGSLERIR
jgi:hypothetical protein